MSTNSTEEIGTCPQCGKEVDPLRAGAVSIAEGQIIHYCSAACREAHLKRETTQKTAAAREPEEIPSTTPDEAEPPLVDQAERQPEPPSSRGRVTSSLFFRFARPTMLEMLGLSCLLAALLIVPSGFLRGYSHPALAACGVVLALITGILRERRKGITRILEAGALPMAATGLIAAGFLGYSHKEVVLSALALLIFERIGRLFEFAGRVRSGILEVIGGRSPTLLASEWRDNSPITARLRHVTIALEWARIPLAVLVGLGLWVLNHSAASEALIGAATVLVALNPRTLRMATGDAYLATALQLAGDGIVIRDAHVVNRVGVSRVVLFMTKRVLVSPTVKVVDWRMVGDLDEGRVISALWALESGAEGRFGKAIREFIENKYGAGPEKIQAQVSPGLGLKGNTTFGRVLCGTRELLLEEIVSTAEHEEWARTVEESGRRSFFVALGGTVAAVFAVEEEPLHNVQEATRGLSLLGMETSMVTSAEVNSALAFGSRLGVENVKFGVLESDLNKILTDMTSGGDTVLLLGHGEAFEESLRSATAAVCLQSDEDSQSGVHARMSGVESLLKITSLARTALRSVRVNIAVAFIVLLLGLGLASSWYYAPIVVLSGALVSVSCAFSTFNGPYPLLRRGAKALKRITMFIRRILGIERTTSA